MRDCCGSGNPHTDAIFGGDLPSKKLEEIAVKTVKWRF